MRILEIRFKNLNSLAGEWQVDLTHPAYAGDGIFAITGPTGAGKSTLLDAVCLALYGRTPRLDSVTQGGNEIMSRQTGECFAEVTFETPAGRYRAHWGQHRARRRPHGALQPPGHELSDARTGTVLARLMREVAARVEETTGMDFDRFTRSTLLAQGGFAAFLQADPDERAPILEKITGTDVYGDISVRVHDRRREERERLQALEAELAGIRLLAPEELEALGRRLAEMEGQDRDLSRRLGERKAAADWLETLERLEAEATGLARDKAALESRLEAFAPERARLAAAEAALELGGAFAALNSLREAQAADRQALQEARTALPVRQADLERAEAARREAEAALENARGARERAAPAIREARDLDVRLAERDAALEQARSEHRERESALAETRGQQEAERQELDRLRASLGEVEAELEATAADARLVEELADIRGRCQALEESHRQWREARDGLGAAETALAGAQEAAKRQLEAREAAAREEASARERLGAKRAELDALLEGDELPVWRARAQDFQQRQAALARAEEALETRREARRELEQLARRDAELEQAVAAAAEAIAGREERRETLQRERGLVEDKLRLARQVADLEAERAQLRDGAPCPLCGALDHPYARGNTPGTDAIRADLDRLGAALEEVDGRLSELRLERARAENDREHGERARADLHAAMTKADERLATACAGLGLDPAAGDLDARLRTLGEEVGAGLERSATVVTVAEALEDQVRGLREHLEQTRAALQGVDRAAGEAEYDRRAATQAVEALQGRVGEREEALARYRQALAERLAPYGVTGFAPDALGPVVEQLTRRRDRRREREGEAAALREQAAARERSVERRTEQIREAAAEHGRRRERLDDQIAEREALAGRRRELLGDLDPNREETRLAAAVDAAREALDEATAAAGRAAVAVSGVKERIAALSADLDGRETGLASAETEFAAALGRSGFADEAGYRAATLAEAERRDLTERAAALERERVALLTREREAAGRLDAERGRGLTDEPLEAVRAAVQELEADQRRLHQEMGATRQRLADDEAARGDREARRAALEAQEREWARWDRLHVLIGSADGKKYRNFAQGLTFEMMIAHANRQLDRMSDRYLLVRDPDRPLELNVIDNYQAGEVRTTKNLSGGESFIVSLALALGLSQMASRNVRVDSLFLDEGFGTLDEEALDTALETLAGLQQDGKVIGVISHVQALKERIGSRIEVVPLSGGRSALEGPGCRPIEGASG